MTSWSLTMIRKRFPKILPLSLISCNSLHSQCRRTSRTTLDLLLERCINFKYKPHNNERLQNISSCRYHIPYQDIACMFPAGSWATSKKSAFFYCKQKISFCVEAVAKMLLFKFLIYFTQSSDHSARLQCALLSALMLAIYTSCMCIFLFSWNFTEGLSTNLLSRSEPSYTVRKYRCFILKFIAYIRSFLDPGCQTIFNKLSNLLFQFFWQKSFPRLISLLCIIML